jgi:hypothetical protein
MADVSPVVIRPLTEADLADADHFELLLDACYRLGADKGAVGLAAGVNAGRAKAWQALVQHGFRVGMQGVTMHRPNDAGYSHSDSYVIDDWR